MTWYLRSDQSVRLGGTRYNLDKTDPTDFTYIGGVSRSGEYTTAGCTKSLYTITPAGVMTLRASTTGASFSIAADITIPTSGGVSVSAKSWLNYGIGGTVYSDEYFTHTPVQANSKVSAGTHAVDVALDYAYDEEGNFSWCDVYFGGQSGTAADGICVELAPVTTVYDSIFFGAGL